MKELLCLVHILALLALWYYLGHVEELQSWVRANSCELGFLVTVIVVANAILHVFGRWDDGTGEFYWSDDWRRDDYR